MRTSILLSIFMIVMLARADAQMLEIGNKWIYDHRVATITMSSYTESIDSIEVVSDTFINGLLYYKLVASQASPCGFFTALEYLREEGDKIYRLSNNLTDENLMIDFSSQDSYAMTYLAYMFLQEVETQVINDSIVSSTLPNGGQLELIYQRIINNSQYEDQTVYKLSREIGYVHAGLLFPYIGAGLCDVPESLNLRCKISGNDTIRLMALDCYQSSIMSSTIDVAAQNPIIYPNPSSGIVKIEGDYEILGIQNLSGTPMSFVKSRHEIDVSHFPTGIYFMTVRRIGDDRIGTYKITRM